MPAQLVTNVTPRATGDKYVVYVGAIRVIQRLAGAVTVVGPSVNGIVATTGMNKVITVQKIAATVYVGF